MTLLRGLLADRSGEIAAGPYYFRRAERAWSRAAATIEA